MKMNPALQTLWIRNGAETLKTELLFFFMGYFTKLSVARVYSMTVKWCIGGHLEGTGHGILVNQGTILAQETSVRRASIPAEIQTRHHQI
jgi:hypothetical protein